MNFIIDKCSLFTDMVTTDDGVNEGVYDALLTDHYDGFCSLCEDLREEKEMYSKMSCVIENDSIDVTYEVSGSQKNKKIS